MEPVDAACCGGQGVEHLSGDKGLWVPLALSMEQVLEGDQISSDYLERMPFSSLLHRLRHTLGQPPPLKASGQISFPQLFFPQWEGSTRTG